MSFSIESALRKADRLHKGGEFAAAQQLYEDILQKFPANKRAQLALQRSKVGLTQKDKTQPNPPKYEIDKLLSLTKNQRYRDALQLCEQLLAKFSNSALVQNIRGVSAVQLGRLDIAEQSFQAAALLQPGDPNILNNLGNILKEQGNISAALENYREAVRIRPDFDEACQNYGMALQAVGDFDQALQMYKEILKRKPGDKGALNNIGLTLLEQRKLHQAIEAYTAALHSDPNYPEAASNRGIARLQTGQIDEAIEDFRHVAKLRPDSVDSHYHLGNASMEKGCVPDAVAAYKAALRANPSHAPTWHKLCGTANFVLEDHEVQHLKNLFLNLNTSDVDRCFLGYALFSALDRLGQIEDAFFYLKAANHMRKAQLQYSFSSDQLFFDKIKASSNDLKDCGLRQDLTDNPLTPIFIVGMPRSGTTLVEQIITSHSNVEGLGELGYIDKLGPPLVDGTLKPNQINLSNIRNRYYEELRNRAGAKTFVTDKTPINFQFIGLILACFPEAKIIHIRREPAATCWSNFKHYFPSSEIGYAYDINDLGNYYRRYEDLMGFWQSEYPNCFFEIDYDQLTREPEAIIPRVIDWIGLSMENACLNPHRNERPIRTLSNQQVRQPIYTGSSEAWKIYHPHLHGAFDNI